MTLTENQVRELEAKGAIWRSYSDDLLLGIASDHGVGITGPLEMQRRLCVAIRQFNEQSSRQADTMIRLTRWIIALTVMLGFIAFLQLWAMLKGVA